MLISAERDGHFAGAPSRLLQQGFKHDLALLRCDLVCACLHGEVFEAAAADLIVLHDLPFATEDDAVFAGGGDDIAGDAVLGRVRGDLHGIAACLIELVVADDVLFVEAGLLAPAPEDDAGLSGEAVVLPEDPGDGVVEPHADAAAGHVVVLGVSAVGVVVEVSCLIRDGP